jgi:ABC-type polar amino acid transport system ATPase subunit
MLKINNISKQLGKKKILDAISFTVQPGEIAFLLGPSGVGKSTLLRLLNNLETLDSGTIDLNGHPLRSAEVGMVFQQFNLFENMTVEGNITFPLIKVAKKTPKEAQTIAHDLLNRYGLGDKANDYVSQLSGGQKQRLAIARSLAMKPRIICLDEPTSALDPRLTNYVAQAIQDLATEGYIVLVASHDIALLKQLDCTLYVMKEKGKIAETATSKEYNKNPDAYPTIKQFIEGTEHPNSF